MKPNDQVSRQSLPAEVDTRPDPSLALFPHCITRYALRAPTRSFRRRLRFQAFLSGKLELAKVGRSQYVDPVTPNQTDLEFVLVKPPPKNPLSNANRNHLKLGVRRAR